jgi:hypothetical protein
MRFGIIFFVAGLVSGQTVLTRVSERPEILHQSNSGGAGLVWNGHLLIYAENNYNSSPILWTLDASGNPEEIRFSMPDAAIISMRSLAGAADGTLAVVGGAMGNGGSRWGFVAIVPPNRGSNIVVRDDAYRPQEATIAPDGVVWTIGDQIEGEYKGRQVLKRYSGSGKLLTSQIVNAAPGNPGSPGVLRSSRDRVGWLTSGHEFIEFALDGHETKRFPGIPLGPKEYGGFMTLALSDDFGVIAQAGNSGKIWTLDRMKKVWNAATVSGDSLGLWSVVYGFDGDQLVVGTTTKERGFLIVHLNVGQ